MNILRIQLNHDAVITKQELASFLYNEIGEEYNLTEENVIDFFSIESCIFIPNQTFVSVFTISLPDLELRDIEPQDIVLSYLNTLNSSPNIISVVKTNDSILHGKAEQYYKEVIELEMDLRNILTYILTYDEKNIGEQLFKDFGINKSEKVDYDKIREKYENGLFYIYFNHYASFSQPEKIKADQIVDLLQNSSIQSFEDFKSKIENRAIKEDRHTQFLLSIKTKLKPIEDMRNAIMHIRNLSSNVILNYEKAVKNLGDEKGIKTLLKDFWTEEKKELNETTWLSIAEAQIDKLILISDDNGERFYKMNDYYYEYEFMEGYSALEEFKDDLISYLVDRVELLDFNPDSVEFELKINELIDKKLLKTD